MNRLTDSELIQELNKRFKENEEALNALRVMTKKLEKLNRKLQEAESLKSNFLSNIRNEINNPLTSIICMSKELAGETLDSETVSSIAGMIHSEAFNLDSQLRNIFAAAEFEAGEAALSISKVDMDMLINSTIELLDHKADKKRIKVNYMSLDESGDETYFNTDSEKVQIVIFNLLGNAIEYSHEEGQVELKAWRHEGHMNISVKDHGMGMDVPDQEIIFDRFRQLDTGVAKSHSGHGLGLSIIKAAIELLYGTVSIECVKDKGCVFTISIPEAESEMEAYTISNDGNEFIFEGVEEF
ncbi:MAG TPA: HAMP domain-containing histidine kinase [Nitrospirae bacterium]|nr:alkaline phosphatase synthesis sensor protein PhoR [bacterium BMS3Abin06]HDH11224.1 HAMP domain-containing histidine kinase [Nitrospirota bacterium]HDZ02465.1 HAMP domain-containing histidine kinase [Nitrospirota bacterium]